MLALLARMCGVFGYVGEARRDLSAFLLEGLRKLEYRGYDSAGIAVFQNGKAKIFKEVGELKNLKRLLQGKPLAGSIGIGHTRWATHGRVSRKNAHPQTDCHRKVVVVHNGIIENYEKLKEKLIQQGHKFFSETDTEVFTHLVEEKLKNKKSFVEAVRLSFREIKGLNAVVACAGGGELVAFRQGSPLVAGIGKKANYISSDIPALLGRTKQIVFLEEGTGVLITREKIFKIDLVSGKLRRAKAKLVRMPEIKVEKGLFKHFLLKEIYEQPEVLARVADSSQTEIQKAVALIKNAFGVYFTACGTAAHAGLAASYWFSEISRKHVNFCLASEFPYFQDFLVPRSLLIAASQSGETIDTLEAVRAAKEHKSKVLAMVNVPGSSLTRLADYTILLKAGPERAVLATKSYLAKLGLFLLFAYTLVQKNREGVEILKKTSRKIAEMFRKGIENQVRGLAKRLVKGNQIFIIGRGVNFATALEGALKIKEASYLHAEGFAGGELKHGVIALVEKGTPCIIVVANDRARESVLSNAMELKSRGGFVIGISPTEESVFDYWLEVPDVGTASPLVNVVPLQLLGYHLAILKGYNPDKPRNLAKSVTVK